MTKTIEIRVPVRDKKTGEISQELREGFVFHHAFPGETTKHRFFIQCYAGSNQSDLADYATGVLLGKLDDCLLGYAINGLKLSKNVKRLAAERLLLKISGAGYDYPAMKNMLSKHETINILPGQKRANTNKQTKGETQ